MWRLIAVLGCTLPLLVAVQSSAASHERPVARIFYVEGSGASAEQARQLARALGIAADLRHEDGSLGYVDPERFLFAPTLPAGEGGRNEDGTRTTKVGLDAAALAAVRVLPEADAVHRARNAFREAGLLPPAANPDAGHARLAIYDARGQVLADAALDTTVTFRTRLMGLPLVGPGARLRVTFDGDGVVTQLRYAWRTLRPGPVVRLITPEEATRRCTERYGLGRDPAADVSARLLYYAPDSALGSVRRIVPHYACGGAVDGALLEQVPIPAVEDAPAVSLDVETDGRQVHAHATVRGGTPPYRFSWASAHTKLDERTRTNGPDITYEPRGSNRDLPERVEVTVTDADGLVASAAKALEFVLLGPADTEPGEGTTIGTEHLTGRHTEAYGFDSTMKTNGVTSQFFKGAYEARERDFKDPAFGGEDSFWADDVDMAYYAGHANGDGWVMETMQDSTFVHYSDTRFGNRDLEWLLIQACGPLQAMWSGKTETERWGPAFGGLHILLGYATTMFLIDGQGEGFADRVLGTQGPPMTIVDAWMVTATEIQSEGYDEVDAAAMGPAVPELVLTGPGGGQPKLVW
jgi:hypothetical protein